MAIDTTAPSYWLNYRFVACVIYIMSTIIFGALLIWKHEGEKRLENEIRVGQAPDGVVYEDEVWKSTLKIIHPVWLFGFRTFAFLLLFGLIVASLIVDGPIIVFFYTQWTFTLTTLYFGFASATSFWGIWCENEGPCSVPRDRDAEQGSDVSPKVTGFLGHVFQIWFQVTAGAVVLTDIVWWGILYPFMAARNYKLSILDGCKHSLNMLVLFETILNNMRFPAFRIAYYILWTTTFVIVQWIIHACVSAPWPYPFMDLSAPLAPLWYATVGLLHFPCYGFFFLVVRLKRHCLSKFFPESYQGYR